MFRKGKVRSGIFPESEEKLIGSFGFCGIAGKGESTAKTQVCQGADRFVSDHSRMIENLLKFSSGCSTIFRRKICFAAKIEGIERKGEVLVRVSQFIRRSGG